MTDDQLLDDLELDVVRTLRAKADQLHLGGAPFHAEKSRGGRLASVPARSRRGRALVAAAAAVVLVGAVSMIDRLGRSDDAGEAMLNIAHGQSYSMRTTGTAAFVPAEVPDGWTLREMNAGATMFGDAETTWQLFSGGSARRGVLVGSARNGARVIPDASHTIHDQPASVRPSHEPLAPAGTLEASWIERDIVHDAVAAGMSESEFVTFLESLATPEDRTLRLDAPADSGLEELAVVRVEDTYSTSLTYAGPAGEDDTVRVTAHTPDHYGGLLHRLVGEPNSNGFVIHGLSSGEQDNPFVSLARDDGWTVEVLSESSPSVAQNPALLDEILDQLQPATAQQFVDIGLARPVTATGTVGDWIIDVHGTDVDNLAMCLTPKLGETVCTTAENSAHLPALTAGSALVNGDWILVVLTDGDEPAAVQTAPSGGQPEVYSPNELHGQRQRFADRVIEVVTVQANVDAVDVIITTGGGEAAGFTYTRPVG